MIYCGNDNYKLEVFKRNLSSEDIKNDLSSVATALNLDWNGQRYESNQTDKKSSIELIKKVQHFDFS